LGLQAHWPSPIQLGSYCISPGPIYFGLPKIHFGLPKIQNPTAMGLHHIQSFEIVEPATCTCKAVFSFWAQGWVVHPHQTTVSIFMDTLVTFLKLVYLLLFVYILISAIKYLCE
jgi:hypothetical protein